MRKPKFWIFRTLIECPVCGSSHEYRERMYNTKKPALPQHRYGYTLVYDNCLEY